MTQWRGFVVACGLAALALGACAANPPIVQPPSATGAGSGGVNRPEHRDKPYLILISFDGFHPEYLERFELPNFRRVAGRGARAPALIPVFPSLTFPNHYSLVTGLYAERHGIVGNNFHDPSREQTYSLRDAAAVSDGTWYRGEPVWVTAERQGMVAACYFWPGSEAAIGGIRPTFSRKFDSTIPNDDRVETVLEWLQLPAERRPHVITLYFSELDSASHRAPLDAPDIRHAAQSLDRTLGVLLDGLDALPIRNGVYLLLTSDHGMVETSEAQTVRLDALVDPSLVNVAFGGAVANVHVHEARNARLVRDRINAGLKHGRAYLREDLPRRYRYSADPRAGDVVVVMDESWTMAVSAAADERDRPQRWGMHGWDPALPSMHALFVVSGPRIPAGVTIPAVENVDVYPLMTELLGLRAADGIDGRRAQILNQITRGSGGS